jgi:hypothetical protein
LAREFHARVRRSARLQPAGSVLLDWRVLQAFRQEEVPLRPSRHQSELYEAKFDRRDLFWTLMVWLEWLTFRTADVYIARSESSEESPIERGRMDPSRVYVVRSDPLLDRLHIRPPVPELRKGRKYLIGYEAVMGKQEEVGLLLQVARHIILNMDRRDVHFGLVGGGHR